LPGVFFPFLKDDWSNNLPDYRKFTEQQAKDMIAAVTKLLGAL